MAKQISSTSTWPVTDDSPAGRLVPKGMMALVRKFADGSCELEDARGRKQRCTMHVCAECERELPVVCFASRYNFETWKPEVSALCNDCRRVYVEEVTQEREKATQQRRIENLGIAEKKRAAILTLASPKWRDRDKIRAIYQEARDLTQLTGVEFHVDHYYPLQGQFCCGLHVPANLRVIEAHTNLSKCADHPLDESPALVLFLKEYGEAGLKKWLAWAKQGAGLK